MAGHQVVIAEAVKVYADSKLGHLLPVTNAAHDLARAGPAPPRRRPLGSIARHCRHRLMRLRLFDWAPSPFCMKVRAVLAYKGVAYERVAVLGPSLAELVRRSNVGKVPALDVDGRMVVDSTDIAHEIERLFPEPAILPADPHLAGLSHALEDWADEALYFLGLYYQWIEPRGRPMVRKAFGSTPLGIAARLFYQRRIAGQLRGQGTGRKSAAQITADLGREFAALSALLAGQPYLLGDRPYLCDFAVNAQLVYLSRPPGSAEILQEFELLGAYMQRMKGLRPAAPSTDDA